MEKEEEKEERRREYVGVAWNARGPRTMPIRRVYLLQLTYWSFHSETASSTFLGALYISSIPLRSLLHLVVFAGSKMNRLSAMRARNFDTLRTSINLIISRHLLSIYKEET